MFLKSRSRYNFLFKLNENNYIKWAKGLKKAGYATDPTYADKLISIIERYELWKLDGSKKSLNKSKEKSLSEKDSINIKISNKYYIVKKGDTLFSISKKFNISISDLISLNKLKNNDIKSGQSLKTKQE